MTHDVVVIDKDREVCELVYAETGAVVIRGSSTDIRILEKAGANRSDCVVCMVRDDAENIATAIMAKSQGIPRVVALMRKPDYEQAYRTVGVTTLISTTGILMNQVLVEIEQPKVKNILSIGGGKAEIYAVQVPPGARCSGMALSEIAQEKRFPKDCVFIGIYHEKMDQFSTPRGDHRLMEYDTAFLVARSKNIKIIAEFLTKGG
jgi:trk system potassium uptake protein TrkA